MKYFEIYFVLAQISHKAADLKHLYSFYFRKKPIYLTVDRIKLIELRTTLLGH